MRTSLQTRNRGGARIHLQTLLNRSIHANQVDFEASSYGFRPGRGPHQALDALTFHHITAIVQPVGGANDLGNMRDR